MRLDNQKFNFNFIESGENIIRCSNVEEAFFNIFNITFDEHISLLKPTSKYVDGHPIITLNVEHNNSVYEDVEFKVVASKNDVPCVFINEHHLINGYCFEPSKKSSSILEEQIDLIAEEVCEEIDWQHLNEQSKQIQENKIVNAIKQVELQLSSRIDESLHDARLSILAESINIQSKAQNSIEQKIEDQTQQLNVLIEQWKYAAEAKISNYIINAIDETRCAIEEQFEVVVQEQQQDSLAILSEKIVGIAIDSKQAITNDLQQLIEHQSNLLHETVKDADENIKQHVAQKLNEFKQHVSEQNTQSFDAGVAGFIDAQTQWMQQLVEDKIANVQQTLDGATIALEQKQDDLAQKLTHHVDAIVDAASSKITQEAKTLHHEQLQNVRQCVDQVISEQIAALQPTTEIIVTEARNTQKNLFKDAIGSIKTEISSEMQAHVANLQQDIYKKFAIYAQSYAGGGSVAQQFANGGTMRGSLNVTNGQILSGGIDLATIFSGGGGGGGGGGGSGLTIFSEVSSIASPNNVIPTFGLSARSLSANVDFAILPKGSGALLSQIPDGTIANGNKRGTYATDWQRSRGAATQVASGNIATIGGGENNTASSDYATVGGGESNTASGQYSFIAGGGNNTASGERSTIGGGSDNTASGSDSFIAGGTNNNTNYLSNTFILGSNITASLSNYTFVNNLSSQGILSVAGGNSNQWNNAATNATISLISSIWS